MDDYVAKPISAKHLLAKIGALVTNSAPPPETPG
jgi:DNA-binding response OmpR family regulator